MGKKRFDNKVFQAAGGACMAASAGVASWLLTADARISVVLSAMAFAGGVFMLRALDGRDPQLENVENGILFNTESSTTKTLKKESSSKASTEGKVLRLSKETEKITEELKDKTETLRTQIQKINLDLLKSRARSNAHPNPAVTGEFHPMTYGIGSVAHLPTNNKMLLRAAKVKQPPQSSLDHMF